jgi:hypothetical protein
VLFSLKTFYPSLVNTGSTMVAVMSFLNLEFNFSRSAYYGNGNLCFQISDGTCTNVTADVWHQLVITVHPKTSKVDFAVDGVNVKTNLPVNLSGFTGLTKFNVFTDDPTWSQNPNPRQATIYLDDIEVRQEPLPKPHTVLMVY